MFFIDAFFDALDKRIEFLAELENSGHEQESLLLCTCYIDGLGQSLYWPDERSNLCFVHVLKEFGGEEILSQIHPRMLREAMAQLKSKMAKRILSKVDSRLRQVYGQLKDETEVVAMLGPLLSAEELTWLKDELWRGTLAAIAYKKIRGSSVHNLGAPGGIYFDRTTHRGRSVPTIDFEMLHGCLRRISLAARTRSTSSAKWFGHDFK